MQTTAVPFLKMHGLGNDFVIIDSRSHRYDVTSARAAAIADRKRGIGCDQLIVLHPSDIAEVRMQIINADGSEVEACGNATRCVASLFDGAVTIETAAGLLHAREDAKGISVDMGVPRFDWGTIPLAYPMDTAALPLAWEALEGPIAVNIGNPHVVFFVEDASAIPLEQLGPMIENDLVFPERINVNIAQIRADGSIALRTWERGVGLTLACGTGACATGVAAIKYRGAAGPVAVDLPGGRLLIDWTPGGNITMTGPATMVFEGSFAPETFG